MVVPKYNEIMAPLLQHLEEKKKESIKDVNKHLILHFKLSKTEIEERTPNGSKALFESRCEWARFYLKRANLIESSKRKYINITNEGKKFTKSHTGPFNKKTLQEIPEFKEFFKNTEYQTKLKKENISKNG
jgi:restriction system protein